MMGTQEIQRWGNEVIFSMQKFCSISSFLFSSQSLENTGDQSHKMPTDRCVRLTLVSMVNDLKEAWISDHPYLAVCYLWQYAPTWAWWLMNKMGKIRIQNFKCGVVSHS